MQINRTKLVYICYVVGVIFCFGCIALYLSADQKGDVPMIIELLAIPGTLLAAFGLVGIHSDHFISVSILANIGFYLLIPYLFWKVFTFWKRR